MIVHKRTRQRKKRKMTFPFITATTAGLLLILQILLAGMTSGARGATKNPIGDGGNEVMIRAVRRHGNLAENAGIFIAGLMLLELSKFSPPLLIGLCVAFVLARLVHAFGLSQVNTNNAFRVLGGAGTYLIGLALGGALTWIGITGGMASHVFG